MARGGATRDKRIPFEETLVLARLVLSLANPGPLRPQELPVGQGARWMRLDTKQALRPVLSLPNPSAMQGARWRLSGRTIKRLDKFPKPQKSLIPATADFPQVRLAAGERLYSKLHTGLRR